MKQLQEKRQWVVNYLRQNIEASCLDQKFHEEFFNKFGGSRKEKYWGAQPVTSAMLILRALERDGTLEVRNITLGRSWQPGFPRRVRSYSLSAPREAVSA